MENNIYGPAFIEKLRFTSYKSTTYAIAEILDNSIDALADIIEKKIKVVFVEKNLGGNFRITEIYFLDNGKGMNKEELSKCLIFSEGSGKSKNRIGAFGIGLPSSSIYIGRRVDVFSRKNLSDDFSTVYLDIDILKARNSIKLDEAVDISNGVLLGSLDGLKISDLDGVNTVVKWSKIDKLESTQADTLIRRVSMLIGRIYRYKIDSMEILMQKIRGEVRYDPIPVIKYDPLFISETPYYITDELWSYSEEINRPDQSGIHDVLGINSNLEIQKKFNAKYYYRKFLRIDDNGNKSQLPLFEKLEGFFDDEFKFNNNGKEYKWKIRATYAKGDISKPGVTKGGATRIGQIIGKKMDGDREIPSANIYFVRAGREIDCDTYRMYTSTDNTNRFWTIEVHFDSDMDELMGVSNDKQSVDFKYTLDSDVENGSEGRDALYSQISNRIIVAINLMKKKFAQRRKEFLAMEAQYLNPEETSQEDGNPIITPDQILKNYISNHSISGAWDMSAKEMTKKLHEKYFNHLTYDVVFERVELYYANLTKEIVLYGDLASGKMFDVEQFGNVSVIIINTDHQFYKNVISVIKSQKGMRYVTTCIEMLLSYMAYEMHSVVEHARDNKKEVLKNAINKIEQQFSMKIAEFITDLDFRIDTLPFGADLQTDDELEDLDDE